MSLQIWLPMNGDINNQGLANATITNTGAVVNNNGKIGKCYQFGTGTSYMNINKETVTNISGACSVCFWLNIISWNTNYSTFFQFGKSNDAWESYIMGMLRNSSGSTCCFTISNGTTASNNSYQTSALTTGIWYHVCLVYQPGKCSIYLNGELDHEYTTTIIPDFSKVTKITIGKSYNGYQTNCLMNDFRIYDEALSPREIKEISKGLVLHYPLNREGFGVDNILTNSSGYEGTTNWSGLVTVGEENNQKYLIAKRTDTTSNSRTFCTHTAITSLVSSWSPGDAFTISGYYKVPSTETYGAQGNMFIRWTHSTSGTSYTDTGFSTVAPSGIIKDEWIRFENTYTVPANYQNGAVNFYLSAFAKALSTIYWKDVKLEKGSHATPWIPSSSDSLYSKLGLSDSIIYDTSGYKYNGTIVDGGISYSSDTVRYNVSAEFDGVNSAIAIPWSTFYKQGDVFTLNLWWKKSSLGSKNYETLFGGSGIEMDTRAGGASTLSLYMASTRGGNLYTPFSFNEWYMNTLVNDGTNELYYVNGQLVKTIEKKNMPTGTCYIGAWTSHTSQNYKGLISDFRIYKAALSADDILELYHTPITLSNNGTLMTQGEYMEV